MKEFRFSGGETIRSEIAAHACLKSGLSFATLVRTSEAVLAASGRSYEKHDIGHTVELEVNGSPSFVVRIQVLDPLLRGNPLLGGLDMRAPKKEVNVAIVLGQEAGGMESAARFVGDWMAALPKEPWQGLGFMQRITAKSLWTRWAAGLEDR